ARAARGRGRSRTRRAPPWPPSGGGGRAAPTRGTRSRRTPRPGRTSREAAGTAPSGRDLGARPHGFLVATVQRRGAHREQCDRGQRDERGLTTEGSEVA